MEGSYSPLAQFIEKVKSDEGLKQRVVDAEGVAAGNIKRDTDAITQIAAAEGFDIEGWSKRPDKTQPEPTGDEMADGCCTFTCCIVLTSTL